MSCIVISVNRVGMPLVASAVRQGDCLTIKAMRVGEGLKVEAGRIGSAAVSALRVGTAIKVQCSQVCELNGEFYLRVSPNEVAWLTEDNGWSYDYEVSSNVEWVIE